MHYPARKTKDFRCRNTIFISVIVSDRIKLPLHSNSHDSATSVLWFHVTVATSRLIYLLFLSPMTTVYLFSFFFVLPWGRFSLLSWFEIQLLLCICLCIQNQFACYIDNVVEWINLNLQGIWCFWFSLHVKEVPRKHVTKSISTYVSFPFHLLFFDINLSIMELGL